MSNLRSGLGRSGILVPQANQPLSSTSLEARPRCSACLISASRQPGRSSLRHLNRPWTHSCTRDFRSFTSTQNHPFTIHCCKVDVLIFVSFLLSYAGATPSRGPGSKPFSPSRLDVCLFGLGSPAPPTSNTREASPPDHVPTPVSRAPSTDPAEPTNKQKNSLQEGLPPSPRKEGKIPVCDARFRWQRKSTKCPSLPKFSLSPPPSCLTAHLDSVFIYRCSSKHLPLPAPIRHRKHVMCVWV